MKFMPYSVLVLELVHIFETSARTSSMTSYNAAFQKKMFFSNIKKTLKNRQDYGKLEYTKIHYHNVINTL